jgi:hypothetical protein
MIGRVAWVKAGSILGGGISVSGDVLDEPFLSDGVGLGKALNAFSDSDDEGRTVVDQGVLLHGLEYKCL